MRLPAGACSGSPWTSIARAALTPSLIKQDSRASSQEALTMPASLRGYLRQPAMSARALGISDLFSREIGFGNRKSALTQHESRDER